MKKIYNIVFYIDENKEKEACIFYYDGSVEYVDFDTAVKACKTLEKEKKLTRKTFRNLINNENIYVTTKKVFKENFNSYEYPNTIEESDIKNIINDEFDNLAKDDTVVKKEKKSDREDFLLAGMPVKPKKKVTKIEDPDDFDSLVDELVEEKPVKTRTVVEDTEDLDDFFEDDYLDDEKIRLIEEEKEREAKRKKRKRFAIGGTIIGVAGLAAIALILSKCSLKTKEGEMVQANLNNPKITSEDDKNRIIIDDDDEYYNQIYTDNFTTEKPVEPVEVKDVEKPVIVSNDNYYNYTYEELLNVTNNNTQKRAMKNLKNTIFEYNKNFADAYIEEGKDIRAALTFEEVVALQQAYNDYSKADIKAYFNGAEVDSEKMTFAYKSAILQLMGAHVIETKENPVDMSPLIESKEGKLFYQRYHNMFLDIKEATGDEKEEKIREFYSAVREDFPITESIRTEGIMHADAYDSIESYKLSVIPMISAAEIMYQNYNIDYTLSSETEYALEIDWLNDTGLCNRATKAFERVEAITLYAEEDDTNPLYSQYRDAIVGMLLENDIYVVDDEHRDLSRLDTFQNTVNWKWNEDPTEYQEDGYYESEPVVETWTETVEEVVVEEIGPEVVYTEVIEADIPEDVKEIIDKEIEQENEEAKETAEEEAEEVREQLQEEEDKNAEKVYEEVEEFNKITEDTIKEFNDTGDVTKEEFEEAHITIDEELYNENDELTKVENITTDKTGVVEEALPDPNVTGAEFDANAPKDYTPADPEVVIYEYEEEYVEPYVEENVQARVEEEDDYSNDESYNYSYEDYNSYETEENYVDYYDPNVLYNENGGWQETVGDGAYVEYNWPSEDTVEVSYEEPEVQARVETTENVVDTSWENISNEVIVDTYIEYMEEESDYFEDTYNEIYEEEEVYTY